MADALNSPYGNAPDDLNSPVPDVTNNFLGQLSQIRVPQGPNAPSLVPPNEAQFAVPPEDPDAALAKEPAHLSAAFHLRPCQLLVGVKMQKWGQRADLRI